MLAPFQNRTKTNTRDQHSAKDDKEGRRWQKQDIFFMAKNYQKAGIDLIRKVVNIASK